MHKSTFLVLAFVTLLAAIATAKLAGLGTGLLLVPVLAAVLVVIHDLRQPHHAILRNFPLLGHARYVLESIRPEINQYFVESNSNGAPFNSAQRSLVYQRAKRETDTVPCGMQRDAYEVGHEWVRTRSLPHASMNGGCGSPSVGPAASSPTT